MRILMRLLPFFARRETGPVAQRWRFSNSGALPSTERHALKDLAVVRPNISQLVVLTRHNVFAEIGQCEM